MNLIKRTAITPAASGSGVVDVELFYVCTQANERTGLRRTHLVRASSDFEAQKKVLWEFPDCKVTCTGEYGIAEDADGVVFTVECRDQTWYTKSRE